MMDYALVILSAVVVISLLLLITMYFSNKKKEQMPHQYGYPKQPQQPQELTPEQKMKKLHEYQTMMGKVRQMSQKPTIENPNHPLLKKVESDTKDFQRERNGTTEEENTPRKKQNYKDAYRNLAQEMRLNKIEDKKKDEENKKKDKKLQNELNTKPLEFHKSVDVMGTEVDSLYAPNPDGSRGEKNRIDEKLDKQLYWSKQNKIISAGMIISGVGLLILLVG